MILYLILLLTFITGQLGRIEIHPGVNIYLHDFVMFLLTVQFLLNRRLNFPKVVNDPLFFPLFAFCFIALVSLLLNPLRLLYGELFISGLYLLRFILYCILYFSLRIEIEKNNINSTLLTLGILGLGIIFSLLGFFQLIYYPNIRNISYLGWDPHYGRLVSSFFDPNFAGIFLVLLFIFAVGVGFEKNVSKILKTCVLLSAIACFIALIFTFSRSSWISFIVGCIVLFSFNKKYRLLFFIILLFILSIILVSKPSGEGGKLNRQSTVTARLNNFDEFIKLSLEKPILGYGFNTLRYLKIKKSLIPKNEFYLNHAAGGVDNSLLFVLVTTGFFGLSAYLFLLFKIVKTALAKFNNNHASALILASSLAVLVHSFFQNTLFYPWVMLYMWMILARRELNR